MLPDITFGDLVTWVCFSILTGFSVGLGIFIASHFFTPVITKYIKYDNLDKKNPSKRSHEN